MAKQREVLFPQNFWARRGGGAVMGTVIVLYYARDHVRQTQLHQLTLGLWGSLKRSARAVQLFGRLAVLETHTL